jgi:nitroreductase
VWLVETWDAIAARRNVRSYDDSPISSDDLERILEAGRRAPSSMNGQPWDFVVVTERDTLRELARAWRYAAHVAGSAATIVLVAADQDERDWIFYDMGQATLQMMVAAADRGIGSSHAGIGDQDVVRRALGIPGDRLSVGMIAFGYPADRPIRPIASPQRRPFDEVIHRDRW